MRAVTDGALLSWAVLGGRRGASNRVEGRVGGRSRERQDETSNQVVIVIERGTDPPHNQRSDKGE